MEYTREQIEKMPAGPLLNRLVSEYVMGNVRRNIDGKQNLLIAPADLRTWEHLYPQIAEGWVEGALDGIGDGIYSFDMNSAWLVVERMQAREDAGQNNAFWFNFWHNLASQLCTLSGKAAAAYICRAALIACQPKQSYSETFAALQAYFEGAESFEA